MLYIVSTPIWNLEDITFRAVRILKEVDLIACEDTRTSQVLFNKYEISTNYTSFHSFSNNKKLEEIITKLKKWKNIALISDAWTPWISDPWYKLVKRAIEEDITISPIPWCSALLSWIVCSWMSMHHFLYLWFLPLKKWRQTLFKSLESKKLTVIIYESVHRIIKTLKDIEKYFWKDHNIVVWRELTKKFEEFNRWKVSEIITDFEKRKRKWEFVIMF